MSPWGVLLYNLQLIPGLGLYDIVLADCDGGSFAGNVAGSVPVPGQPGAARTLLAPKPIWYRGHAILDAVLDSLIAAGLGKAKLFIVNGAHARGAYC